MTRKASRWYSIVIPGIVLAIGGTPTASIAQEPSAGAPKFRSLSAGGNASWIRHVNGMSEAERQQRIGNYHPASLASTPPQRVEPSSRPGTFRVPARPAPSSERLAPAARPTVRATVRTPTRSAQPEPAKTRPRLVSAPSPPRTATVASEKPAPRVRRAPKRSAPPSLTRSATPAPKKASLRTQLAYVSARNRTDYPYAPYASKEEYEAALAKASWRPTREPSKPEIKKSSKFSLASLFRRSSGDKASRESTKKSKRGSSRSDKKAAFASNGLPQPTTEKGPVIQTTLFGS